MIPLTMKFIKTLFFLQALILTLSAQSGFNTYFQEGKLRFDYAISGNSTKIKIHSPDFFYENNWGGSKINTIDTFQYGEMLLEVFDSVSNKLIYSRGYSSLFKEWQTINEADSTNREFHESVIMPFPAKTIKIIVSERSFNMKFQSIYSLYLNPEHSEMKEKKVFDLVEVRNILLNGNSSSKVDLVFISEGYIESDSSKFYADARKKGNELFQWDPYSNYRDAFNIYAVFVPSENNFPKTVHDTMNSNTALHAHFNTFGSERYLTTEDISGVRDVLTDIPYDQICILVNSTAYGGGGIFNFITIFTVDNEHSEFLFHHELGHGFSSLADEYYSSLVPYNSYFDLNYEPYQPNITTGVNFKSKWADLVSDTIPVPTPNLKKYEGITGLFEGGGYSPKGVFRPSYNCSMKSIINDSFCPVCKRAIEQMILFYSAE